VKNKKKILNNIKHILLNSGNLNKKDKLLVLYDKNTENLSKLFLDIAKNYTNNLKKIIIKGLKNHGQNVNQMTLNIMKKSTLILSICNYSLAHSKARLISSKLGARFLSLPGYSLNFIKNNSINVDYKKYFLETKKISNMFSKGKKVQINCPNGTNLCLNITNRKGNCCPGFVKKPGDLGSPPDIEANVSPIEFKSNGRAVINGSVTHPSIGKLNTKVIFEIKNGFIVDIISENKNIEKKVKKIFKSGKNKRKILAECGIGLNPKATISGNMLTDEGSRGCVHLGFGSNYTVGGKNKVNFHVDCVIRKPSLLIDNKKIIKNGKICRIQ